MTDEEKIQKIREIESEFLLKIKKIKAERAEKIKVIKKSIDQKKVNKILTELKG